jgi:hypothetical protein
VRVIETSENVRALIRRRELSASVRRKTNHQQINTPTDQIIYAHDATGRCRVLRRTLVAALTNVRRYAVE